MSKIILPHGIEGELAEYKKQAICDYENNPLIEALPEIMNKNDVIDKLSVYPEFDNSERYLDSHLRYHCIQRLFRYFQPLSIHLELESKISRIIRQGYIARNPLSPQFVRATNEEVKNYLNNNDISDNKEFTSTASSFTLIGCSGIGKSTSVGHIISTIPQLIVHSSYKDINFSMYQLVWLKLDAPYDGSIKGLCLDFFSKIDNLLGTSYYKKYGSGRISANAMLPLMALVAKQCSLGLIILDEIQHLSMAKSGGSQKILNFFVTLINTVGVPVIMIGTPKAIGIFQSEFRQARRSEGVGGIFWDRMENDESFKLLLEGLWDYQWTRKVTPIAQEFIDIMYEESMGITDIIIKLFVMAQIKAISNGNEEISDKLIRKVAEENFKLIKPMLKALKSGNLNKIAVYDDIADINIDTFIKTETSKIDFDNKIRELQQVKKQSEENNKKHIKEQAILRLIDLDVEKEKAIKYVDKILNADLTNCNVNNLVKLALKEILDAEQKGKNKTKTKDNVSYNVDDIRLIVKQNKNSNTSAYQLLKQSNYIKEFESILRVGEI